MKLSTANKERSRVQSEALKAIVAEFELGYNRCWVEIACGVGKTRLQHMVAIAMGAKTIVIFAPQLDLVAQHMKEWLSSGLKCHFFVFASKAEVNDADDCGATVSTKPANLKSWMRMGADSPALKVVFCTYQSATRCAEGFNTFDLGICDEAHVTTNVCNADPTPKAFYSVYDKKVFTFKHLVSMTATPIRRGDA
jgi:predicted helicase